MFTPLSLLLSFVVASLIGLAFYLLFGKGWLRFGVYWVVAVVGFMLGQIIAALLNFSLLPIGSVNLLEASAASLIALFLTRLLWRGEPAA